ncbi:MAG: hypothetical protein M1833_006501 [Piccolia ochrophora]|nr:MAG: hypothetical protein M1833_006501 [Piccolia ochrophora]
MTSVLAKYISKKVLGETSKNHFGKEDPYFERVPATRLSNGKSTSKTTRRRKANPPGLSEKDGKVLTKAKRRAYRLDMGLFSFLGVRFGWGSVIGLIPAIGDVLDMFMAVMVIQTCRGIEGGLPTTILAQMFLRVVADFFMGLVPFLGDIVDAAYKANTYNVMILEKYLRQRGAENLKKQGQQLPLVDPSLPDVFDRGSEEELGPRQHHGNQHHVYDHGRGGREQEPGSRSHHGNQTHVSKNGRASQGPARPQQAVAPDQRKGSFRDWFRGGSRREPQPDVEMGERRPHAQHS